MSLKKKIVTEEVEMIKSVEVKSATTEQIKSVGETKRETADSTSKARKGKQIMAQPKLTKRQQMEEAASLATIAEIQAPRKKEQARFAALEAKDAELARKVQHELEGKMKLKTKSVFDFKHEISSEEVQHMVDTNPEIKKKELSFLLIEV